MTFLVIVLIVLALLAGFIASRPSVFTVTRSATMWAPPATVFAQVNDFHNWNAWSPWAKMDPGAKNSFEGPASGTGAGFKWSGNRKVGQGGMTITESRPDEQILIRLEFVKPFKAVNATTFTFKPQNGKTLVTWTMAGENNFIGKAFSAFMDCEKMIGGQFDQGLANMKTIVEKAPVA